MNTIKSKWEFFELTCLQNVSDQQREGARIASYTGVMSLLSLQDKAARKIESVDQAAAFVHIWEQELQIFKAEVIAKAILATAQQRH